MVMRRFVRSSPICSVVGSNPTRRCTDSWTVEQSAVVTDLRDSRRASLARLLAHDRSEASDYGSQAGDDERSDIQGSILAGSDGAWEIDALRSQAVEWF
jgi:hypothetical protein